MMTYIEKNRRNSKSVIIFGMSAILAFFILLLNHFFPLFLSKSATYIARPFWRIEYAYNIDAFDSVEKIIAENQSLKQQLDDIKLRESFLQATEDENRQLRSSYGMSSSTKSVLSAIIKKPPFLPYDIFIIDAGKSNGLSTSSLVHAPYDIPLGKVIEVYEQTSKVLLYSSPNQKNYVTIGERNIPAQAIGRGGGQYLAELPRGLDIKLGDIVRLSEQNKVLGKIDFIDQDPSLSFERIYFSLPVNIYQLRLVKVSI